MNQQTPSVTLLIGDNENAVAAYLEERIRALGDPSAAELNLTRLDGRQASEEEIRTAANAIPFLSHRRLLILNHPLARAATEEARGRFCSFLENLPPVSEVILLLTDRIVFKQGEKRWETFHTKHWLIKWAERRGESLVQIIRVPLPTPYEMPGWIRKHAQDMGGQFTPAAAATLAGCVDNNTRLANLEIEKLLLYTDGRPVEADDVDLLTANTSQAGIFEMVDALSSGNAGQAARLFYRLLEEEEEYNLFGMIVRQFRLLLLTREILDENGGLDIVQRDLNLSSYPAKKMIGQAQGFTIQRLEQIYRRLLEIDIALKTGQTTLSLAFDLLAADLSVP
ncbi:MAG: DNA polymerase III subunit delta [Anaerolineaceae bacterium]|nr:DNA polymerase III subunit delta [Anaerolineaceae bacterium]